MTKWVFEHSLSVPVLVVSYRTDFYCSCSNSPIETFLNIVHKQTNNCCYPFGTYRLKGIEPMRCFVQMEDSTVDFQFSNVNASVVVTKTKVLGGAELSIEVNAVCAIRNVQFWGKMSGIIFLTHDNFSKSSVSVLLVNITSNSKIVEIPSYIIEYISILKSGHFNQATHLHPLIQTPHPFPEMRRWHKKNSIPYFLTLTGKAGVFIFFGGLAFSCCMMMSMAFSSCGSRPAITSAGHCSTSTSGGVPTFSMPKPCSL